MSEALLPQSVGDDSTSREAAVAAYNAFVLKHTWYNLVLNVADGAIFAMGMALVPVETVLPGFIKDCADRVPGLSGYGNTLVGVLLFILSICFMMPQQLWISHICERRALLMRPMYVFAIMERVPWLMLGIMTALVAGRRPGIALYIFFAVVFYWQSSLGLISPIWQEMVAKVTPVNRRGLLFGIRESLGGALGFLTLLVANRYMGRFSFPDNYTVLFFATFVFVTISAIPLALLREAPYPVKRSVKPLMEHMHEAWDAIFNNKPLRNYIWCRIVFGMSAIAAPSFFAVRATGVIGQEATVKLMVEMAMVIVLSRMVISIVIGPAGDLFGYRVILTLAGVTGAAGIVCALAATGPVGFYAAFALSTLSSMSFWLGHTNYILELAPPEKRPSYISLDNMMGLPVVAVPFVGGWLADKYGYTIPFALGIALSIISAAMFAKMCVEPRKKLKTELVA